MNYHNILHDDMRNGDGLRVTLFVSGCDHFCKDCQNPQTWDKDGGILFDHAAKLEIFNELEHVYISGLTVSGGDPLYFQNYKDVFMLLREVKMLYPNKTVWVYTGFLWEDVCNLPIMQYIDILVDGEFVDELADVNYKWAGSTNQRVIDVRRSKETDSIVLWE